MWEIVEDKLTLLSTLNTHSNGVNKVISSIKLENKIISCSNDCKIIIWKSKNNSYKKERVLKEEGEIYSILELQHDKLLLVANVKNKTNKSSVLSFWNINLEKRGKFTSKPLYFSSLIDSMIEVGNGLIAVSTSNQGMTVSIVNPVKPSIINRFELEGSIEIGKSSSLSKYDNTSFIFSNNESFKQIEFAENELQIMFTSSNQNLQDFDGSKGLLVVNDGKIIISVFQTGFCVINTVVFS